MVQAETPVADARDIRAAVNASAAFASTLFDQLRRDGLDEPGVSRDTYGPGNSAHTQPAPKWRRPWD